MNANLKAIFDCFIDKSLLKCLVVNDNVNNAYRMPSFSMSRSLLQFSSRLFFGLTWSTGLKIETNLRGCNKKRLKYGPGVHLGHIGT